MHEVIAISPRSLVYLILFSSGCGTDSDPNGSVVRVDSAGIPVVVSSHAVRDVSDHWRVSSTPTLTITTPEQDGGFVLDRIRGTLRLDDGRIVALSESDGSLMFFGSDGAFAQRAGGLGDGPGELRRPVYLSRDGSDHLIVTERFSGRESRFSNLGVFLNRSTPDRAQLMSSVPEGYALRAERFLAPGHTIARADDISAIPIGKRFRPPRLYVLMPPGALAPIVLGPFGGWEVFNLSRSHGRWAFFAENTYVATGGSPRSLYIGDSGVHEIRQYSSDGELKRVIRDPVEPPSITAEDIAWERWEILDWGRQSDQVAELTRLADAMPIPESKPGFDHLVVDRLGYIWTREYGSYRPQHVRYRIYTPNGERVGAVYLPGRFHVFDIGVDYILGVHSDLDYVERIHLYDLRRASVSLRPAM